MTNTAPRKLLTFSYDDGIFQDIRLIRLLEKYGMRGTFHICSGLLGESGELIREGVTVGYGKIPKNEIKSVYQGHEVSAHTVTHKRLTELSDTEIIREVEDDRAWLSELVGYEVCGLAYPFGARDERVMSLIRNNTGVRYARTSGTSRGFGMPSDMLALSPSARHYTDEHWRDLFTLGERFISLNPESDAHLCVMGHAYEFDIHNTWDKFESFLKMMAGHADITYATLSEATL